MNGAEYWYNKETGDIRDSLDDTYTSCVWPQLQTEHTASCLLMPLLLLCHCCAKTDTAEEEEEEEEGQEEEGDGHRLGGRRRAYALHRRGRSRGNGSYTVLE